MKSYLNGLATFFAMLFAADFAAAADEIAWHTDVAAAVADAEARELPILVYLTSSHCPYCVKMKSQTLAAPAVTTVVGERFVALSVSRGAAPELERRLNVRAYPTTVVLRPDQSEIGRVTGYVAATQLTTSLQRFEALHVAAKTATTTVK
ncbi:MAG: thioredoxin family protein [Pirellulales bacterium]